MSSCRTNVHVDDMALLPFDLIGRTTDWKYYCLSIKRRVHGSISYILYINVNVGLCCSLGSSAVRDLVET